LSNTNGHQKATNWVSLEVAVKNLRTSINTWSIIIYNTSFEQEKEYSSNFRNEVRIEYECGNLVNHIVMGIWL
jgi:hypothetical protein